VSRDLKRISLLLFDSLDFPTRFGGFSFSRFGGFSFSRFGGFFFGEIASCAAKKT
jgi:hypothetical protein